MSICNPCGPCGPCGPCFPCNPCDQTNIVPGNLKVCRTLCAKQICLEPTNSTSVAFTSTAGELTTWSPATTINVGMSTYGIIPITFPTSPPGPIAADIISFQLTGTSLSSLRPLMLSVHSYTYHSSGDFSQTPIVPTVAVQSWNGSTATIKVTPPASSSGNGLKTLNLSYASF